MKHEKQVWRLTIDVPLDVDLVERLKKMSANSNPHRRVTSLIEQAVYLFLEEHEEDEEWSDKLDYLDARELRKICRSLRKKNSGGVKR